MTNNDIKFLLLTVGGGIFVLTLGAHGILNRKKINKISDFYMSINFLLEGVIMIPFFILSLFFWLYAKEVNFMSKNVYYLLASMLLGLSMLAAGAHGILNKKKINNSGFFKISISQLIGSIFIFVGEVVYCLVWGWPK